MTDEAKRLDLNALLLTGEGPLKELHAITGGSPLAIKWAIGQMKRKGQPLTSVIAIIKAARGDLFEEMFATSWGLLSNSSKDVLLATPIFDATVSREALATTSNIYSFEFDEALGHLVELWLVEPNQELTENKQRFGVHPLTRSFVNRELSKIPSQEKNMHLHAATYYLQFCNDRRLMQKRGVGYDEIEAEVPNIGMVIDWLYSNKTLEQSQKEILSLIVAYSEAINVFFWSRGFWGERVSLCERALDASVVLGDWSSAGKQAYFIGIVRIWQGAVDEAERWAKTSLSYMERTGNPKDRYLAQRLIGLVLMGKKEYQEATSKLKEVLEEISKSSFSKQEDVRIFADWICPGPEGYQAGIVSLNQELGIVANRKGEYSTAKKWLDTSIEIGKQIGDTEGLSISYSHLGHALFGLRLYREAKNAYAKGLELATQVQRKSTMGRCNQGLSNIASIERKPKDAIKFGSDAIILFEKLGMLQEKAEVEKILSRFHTRSSTGL